MEALGVEKTPSPSSKRIKNRKRNALHPRHLQLHHHQQSQAAVHQRTILMHHGGRGGVFSNPISPFSLSSSSSLPPHNHHQPPLLPLPAAVVSNPAFLSLPPPTHSLSKTKQQRQKAKKSPNPAKSDDVVEVQSSVKWVGPDSGNDPKEVTHVEVDIFMEKFSGSSVFSLSPPPSSLPFPKFSLVRQSQTKLRCTAEVVLGEVDDGVTDKLCRLLRLR